MDPIVIESKDQFDSCLKDAGDKLVVVDFTATWCGPCKMIAPVFKDLSHSTPNVMFLKVDVDDVPEVTEAYDISAMPTFVFFKNKKEVHRFSGANVDNLKLEITKHA
ncbi:thioredoxin b [Neosynchiropus ocellatus]